MRFYSRYKVIDDQDKIATLNGMFLAIFSFLGIIAIIAGIILALNVDIIFGPSLTNLELETARVLMFILVINLGVSFPNIVFSTYIQANEQFIFANSLQIVRQISTPLVSLPLLLAGYGSIGMVIGTTLVNIIMEIINIYYSLNKLNMHFSFTNFDMTLLKEMSVYSFYIFINMVVDQVNQNVDKTLLGRYSGTLVTAVYSVGERMELMYQQLSTAISNVFTPRVHRMVASNISDRDLTLFFTKVGRIQFILLSLVLSGFIFFGRPFIGIWAGDNYYDAYPIALILMITITIPLIQNVGVEIQRAKNMHQFRSWTYLFMAIGNILITIPLIQRFGGFGAAIGTSLSYLIGNGLVMNLYNHFKIGLDMGYFWKEIATFIPAFIIPTLYGLLINNFVDLYSVGSLLICGVVYVVIFAFSIWLFGLNEYEKNLLENLF